MTKNNTKIQNLRDAFDTCRRSFVSVGVFSLFINLLMLTPMFYMINVYDKAVATGSLPTLMSLVVIAAFLYLMLALLEWVRSVVMVHVASRLDHLIAPRVYELSFKSEAGSLDAAVGSRPLSDLNALRQFVASPTAAVVFDIPWIPLFLIIMYFFHPVLAFVAVICMAIMFGLALANQRSTTKALESANEKANRIHSVTERNLRNAEVASAMGMMAPLMSQWRSAQDDMLETQTAASNSASAYGSVIKTLSTAMQSAAITTGAILAMAQEISPGVMIGAALLLGKTLQPIQQAVNSWTHIVRARGQYFRLSALLEQFPIEPDKLALPPITGRVTAHDLVVVPPGGTEAVVKGVSFQLEAGTATMVIGPSGAGKSSLVRAILGIWPAAGGEMRVDGADVGNFDRLDLGPQIGYLPQDIELFDGTIAQNISRFGEINAEKILQAAMDAGVHELILSLPEGYDTVIRGKAGLLSPGQRQRIALARALHQQPKLLVLDEPNSNLDDAGERALATAIQKMKAAGATVILVSHRQGTLPLIDNLIIMSDGVISDQGPKDQVLGRVREAIAAQQKQAAEQQTAAAGPDAGQKNE